jgi:hypothetical protein
MFKDKIIFNILVRLLKFLVKKHIKNKFIKKSFVFPGVMHPGEPQKLTLTKIIIVFIIFGHWHCGAFWARRGHHLPGYAEVWSPRARLRPHRPAQRGAELAHCARRCGVQAHGGGRRAQPQR